MTSKERMMRALNGEKPDRLPVSLHQWQQYHLDKYLDGMSDLDAFEKFGFDAQAQYFGDVGQTQIESAALKSSTENWKIEPEVISSDPDNRAVNYTIHTPQGTLTYKSAGDRKTTWVTEYMVKQDEDIRLIGKYMPVPTLSLKPVSKLYDQLGDRGFMTEEFRNDMLAYGIRFPDRLPGINPVKIYQSYKISRRLNKVG